ncbi:sarcosine oxidase subunit delta [Agrobacterium rosae]|uniref:Sarcosine oxidase subunit delta n=1 Tax=Agrobacterium rosae TaxID=1972867 RepID=A0AAE5RVT3_9HYPH|nr:sarcosine oxidase subunit delta [Agrobacterium rosae]KAA3515598.1 sarcosine oxidase subunit delta [Agrobacterium rosae]KAA3524562.1 sarcosine oxidase subunit delta [Agrobacterium rosae]MCM2431489.1 sarcosine oxidase subunit delta [Agrobacterium rosae]MQB46938.1 sarcosine oxidase subunit delta [Agrobacterium rosae]POO50238.1 sarcosine oxidase subunit delta [Agrobacterium rosae]
MASLISCPHCGARPKEEFTIKGAALARPSPDAGTDVWKDYVYLRENPRGLYEEYWHHTSGCRRWLVVTRDTATHEIEKSRDVAIAQASDIRP